MRHDARHEPHAGGLVGADDPAGEQQLGGPFAADDAGETTESRDIAAQPALDEQLAEPCPSSDATIRMSASRASSMPWPTAAPFTAVAMTGTVCRSALAAGVSRGSPGSARRHPLARTCHHLLDVVARAERGSAPVTTRRAAGRRRPDGVGELGVGREGERARPRAG